MLLHLKFDMRSTALVSLVAAVLALGIAVSVWLRESRTNNESPVADPSTLRAFEVRLTALEQRVDELAHRPPMLENPGAERRPADDPRLEERVIALEKAIADLRLASGEKPPLPTEASKLQDAIDLNRLKFPRSKAQREECIAMLKQFLDLYPSDPKARQRFDQLMMDQLTTDPADAVTSLERYRSSLHMDPAEYDNQYANALEFADRFDESQRLYADLIRRPGVPEKQRWNAQFSKAYQLMDHGRLDEARSEFQTLVSDCEAANTALSKQTLEGAKNQLAEIERRSQH